MCRCAGLLQASGRPGSRGRPGRGHWSARVARPTRSRALVEWSRPRSASAGSFFATQDGRARTSTGNGTLVSPETGMRPSKITSSFTGCPSTRRNVRMPYMSARTSRINSRVRPLACAKFTVTGEAVRRFVPATEDNEVGAAERVGQPISHTAKRRHASGDIGCNLHNTPSGYAPLRHHRMPSEMPWPANRSVRSRENIDGSDCHNRRKISFQDWNG